MQDKKFIILGDRDGVPGPAIEECIKSFGGKCCSPPPNAV